MLKSLRPALSKSLFPLLLYSLKSQIMSSMKFLFLLSYCFKSQIMSSMQIYESHLHNIAGVYKNEEKFDVYIDSKEIQEFYAVSEMVMMGCYCIEK